MNTLYEYDTEFLTKTCPYGCRGDTTLHDAFLSGLMGEVRRRRRSPGRQTYPRALPRRPKPRPPRPRPRPGYPPARRRIRRVHFPGPYPFEPEPSSEYTRWIQYCLNQAMGLRLPLTGFMGPETRSAIRDFQLRQGLRASGIADPDTVAAIKAACTPQIKGFNGNYEIMEEATLGPVSAALKWLPDSKNPKLFTRNEARNTEGGGIYLAIDTDAGNRPLKVGVASSFKVRLGHAIYVDMENRRPGLRFYLAHIHRGRLGGTGIGGADKAIERSIARILYRAGEKLPEHQLPYKVVNILGRVNIANVLPGPLLDRLHRAYIAAGTDPKSQLIPGPYSAIPRGRRSLILEPSVHSKGWELQTI